MDFSTIPQIFLSVTDHFRGNTDKYVFMRKVAGKYVGIYYDELREMVESFAAGLDNLGIHPGDRIGIASENRLEWIVADFAITGIGIVDVPIFPTLTAKQEQYIFEHCSAVAIIVSNTFQLNKILKIKEELPALRHIIVMNDDIQTDDTMVIKMSDIIRAGASLFSSEQRREWFERRCSSVKADDLLTIIYTSGTTGNPKGVLLTHKNLTANISGAWRVLPLSEKDTLLSYLPLCHSYERLGGYYTAFSMRCTIAFAESIETVAENLREVRPTIMTSVPRLFERIRNRILASVEKDKPAKQKIFHWAIGVGKEYAGKEQSGNISLALRAQYAIADKLVFTKIRERVGGRLRYFISGGAALPREVGEFFHAFGLKIMEGYGLTETSPVLTINYPDSIEIGTVGKPLFNVQIKIAEDGEILGKGDNIMVGYLNDDEATRATIDEDGWLHTGDIGHINERGNLVITDRKKHIFVSSGGKNIAPQPIENALSQSRYVDQVLLIGEKREYCTALIVPDYDALKNLAKIKSINFSSEKDLTHNRDIIREVERDILDLQRDFSKFEKVRKISLLDEPFTVENGYMTPTLKIKRKVVEKTYAELIEKMYGA